MPPDSPYLTVAESCVYLKRCREWLRQHADAIGCYREGGRVYFAQRDLDIWRQRHYTRPAAEPAPRASRPKAVRAIDGSRINGLSGLPIGAYARQTYQERDS